VATGILKVDLFMSESDSLKARRRILKSIKDRARARFNVSISEIGEDTLWQRATLGIACVTRDRRHADQVFSRIINMIEGNGSVEIINQEVEFL
jgi:uncharacterized protein YlxP (DUF503 family)